MSKRFILFYVLFGVLLFNSFSQVRIWTYNDSPFGNAYVNVYNFDGAYFDVLTNTLFYNDSDNKFNLEIYSYDRDSDWNTFELFIWRYPYSLDGAYQIKEKAGEVIGRPEFNIPNGDFPIRIHYERYKWFILWWTNEITLSDETITATKDNISPIAKIDNSWDTNRWYLKNDLFAVLSATDSGSGIALSTAEYSPWMYKTWKSTPNENEYTSLFPLDTTFLPNGSINIPLTASGKNNYTFRVVDRVGNPSNEVTCTARIDDKIPNKTDLVTGTITASANQINSIHLSWNTATDIPTGEDGIDNSGVAGYEIGWILSRDYNPNGENIGSQEINGISLFKDNTIDININEAGLIRGQTYRFAVQTVDNAGTGNKSGWAFSDEITIPPEAFEIEDITSESIIKDSVPTYNVSITFDKGKAALLALSGKPIVKGITIINETLNQATFIPVGQIIYAWEEEGEHLVYTFTLSGAEHAHKVYTYSTTTTFIYDDVMETGSTGIIAPAIANIVPDFLIQIKDSEDPDERPLAVVDKEGYITGTRTPLHIYTNKELFFYIVMPNTNGTDLEGDTAKYTLIRKVDSGSQEIGSALTSISGNIRYTTSPLSSVNHCYIALQEYEGSKEISPASYTVHGNPMEGFYIYFDFVEGNGFFKIRSADGSKVYEDVNSPTINNSVQIYVPKDSITDAIGPVESGIESVYVWNCGFSGDISQSSNILQIIKDNEPQDALKRNLLISCDPGVNAPVADKIEPWGLTPCNGAIDGLCLVVMKITDKADSSGNMGNVQYFWQFVLLDTTPPGIASGFSHNYTGNSLNIHWTGGDGADHYRVEYLTVGGSTASVNTATNSFVIEDTSGYDRNTAIPVTVYCIDKAGNESAGVSYTPYSSAALGSIVSSESLYSTELGHYFKWTMQGGTAETFIIEILNADDSVFRQSSFVLGTNGSLECIIPGLERHQTYRYRLAALNHTRDVVRGETFSMTVTNNPPLTSPELISPKGYSTCDVQFRWRAPVDPDGDAITYCVYLKEATESAYTLLGTVTGSECKFPAGDGMLLLENEKHYYYYVTADDTPLNGSFVGTVVGDESIAAEFYVDGVSPVIEFTSMPDFSQGNTQPLVMKISDNYSGLGELTYKKIQNDTEIEAGAIPFQIESGNNYTASIDLATGDYIIAITAVDKAGNRSTKQLNLSQLDSTSPQISEIIISLPQVQSGILGSSGIIPVKISVSDDNSGIKGICYGFAESAGGTVASWNKLDLEGFKPSYTANNEIKTYERNLVNPNSDGTTRYLVVQAYDWAGNFSSEWKDSPAILTDRSAPTIQAVITGFHVALGRNYTQKIEDISVTVNAVENESGPARILYAIATPDTDIGILSWNTDITSAKSISTTNGETYAVFLKAENSVGLSAIWKSPSFVLDTTGAIDLNIFGFPTNTVVPGEEIRLSAMAIEAESVVSEYRISIGTAENSSAFSKLVNGNQSGWLVNANNSPADFIFTVPAITDGTYSVVFETVNGAGITSRIENAGNITVDNSQERLLVYTTGAYSSSRDTLSASWRYTGVKSVDGYNYRILRQNGTVFADWKATADLSVTTAGLDLENSAKYYFSVRATLSDGTTITGNSKMVTVDYTSPVFGTEGLETPRFATSTGLWIDYDVTDAESGIAAMEVLVEKAGSDGLRTVVGTGWIGVPSGMNNVKIPISADAQGNRLDLVTGNIVCVTLRAINKAGGLSEIGSPCIIIDDTPPPKPVVLDQGDTINTSQDLEAHWMWSEQDPESGTVKYEWTVVSDVSSLTGAVWCQDTGTHIGRVGEAADLVVLKNHLAKYYFVVRATNGSGLYSCGYSNGITYDQTAPFVAGVKLIQGSDEVFYISDFTDKDVQVNTVEDVSKISRYDAVCGTLNEGNDWIPLPDATVYTLSTETTPGTNTIPVSSPAPQISPGDIVIFRANAINTAALVSEYGYTKGALIFQGNPAVTMVRTRVSGTIIYADWDVDLKGVPLGEYTVVLKQEGSGPSLLTLTTKERSITLDVIAGNIPDGDYMILVTATNIVGNSSIAKAGPGFALDRTPPVIAEFKTPGFASKRIGIYCAAADADSGISEYQYAIGTFENPNVFTGGWKSILSSVTILNTSVSFEELGAGFDGVVDGSSVYVRIRVKNGTGLWTGERVSDPVIIDKSTATIPVISVEPAYTAASDQISGISVNSEDPQSGISRWAYAVTNVNTAEALLEAVWVEVPVADGTSVLDVDDFIATGLSLEHGSAVYLFAGVQNGAGEWSRSSASAEIRVDLSPPVITFNASNPSVVNSVPVDIKYTLTDGVSSEIYVTFTLVRPDGSSESFDELTLGEGTHIFVFNKNAAGTYKINAQCHDIAGNTSEEAGWTIRINAAPEITLSPIDTTPGKPIELSATVYDPDGTAPALYRWTFGDGSGVSNEARPVHKYYQNGQYVQKSTYIVELEVTDQDGKTTKAETTVTVENTRAGRLYTNEFWNNTHEIWGNIVVPEGLTLTVMTGTQVSVAGDPAAGYDHRLTIEGALKVEPGVVFKMKAGLSGTWNGILVSGSAVIDSATISQAKRGLVVASGSQVTIENTIFDKNNIGMHVFAEILIQGCSFTGNTEYGIKEEGVSPTVKDCAFGANAFDYYDFEQTVMTADELNGISGNSGNTRQ